MKKSLLTIALLGACSSAAFAQSNVTIYGIIDGGLLHESGGIAGPVTKLGTGTQSQSRLGFKGTEDLGGGMHAGFVLESGISIDNGTSTQGGATFGRNSYVKLDGNFGAVQLGRFFTPLYVTLVSVADPFQTGFAGDSANLMATTGTRTNNTIKYTSPSYSGASAELAYVFGELAGNNVASRQIGAAIAYANGPLNLRASYNNKDNNTTTTTNLGSANNALFAGNYNFGMLTGYMAYGINHGLNSAPLNTLTANPYGSTIAPTASVSTRDILLGATVPFGASTVIASFINRKDQTALAQNARQYAIGYTYALSKKTNLYTSIGHIVNQNGAGYTVGNSNSAGSGSSAYNMGVRMTF